MNNTKTWYFYRVWSIVCCCAVLIWGWQCGLSALRADESRKAILEQEPLAESKVQIKEQAEEPERPNMNFIVGIRPTDPQAGLLALYARGHDGQWVIPAEVDREDPWIRLLVMGPAAPLVIDLAVTIEGKAFRDLREAWVDSLVKEAVEPVKVAAEKSDEVSSNPESENQENETAGDEVAEQQETEATEAGNEETLASTSVKRRQAPTVVERLRHYLAAGVDANDREEIRWLLAEWAGGPGLLTLGPAFSWKRAENAPLWSWLDQNHDHMLSSQEIEAASEVLRRADTNRDDVIDLGELEQADAEYSPYPKTLTHPLVEILNEQTHWGVLRKRIVRLYGNSVNAKNAGNDLKSRVARGDATLTGKDLEGLLSVAADVVGRVDLAKEDGRVALFSAEVADGGEEGGVWSNDQQITIDCGGTYLELSALSIASGEDAFRNQVAVGAVVDGYPLFRLLDQDGDRRLILRECRKLSAYLADLDSDSDGSIAGEEIPTAIRLTVTRGLLAQDALGEPTVATRAIPTQQKVEVPSWFTKMDRNRDGDLSRREFLGTAEQFDRIDQNQDGLINAKEVQDWERRSE